MGKWQHKLFAWTPSVTGYLLADPKRIQHLYSLAMTMAVPMSVPLPTGARD